MHDKVFEFVKHRTCSKTELSYQKIDRHGVQRQLVTRTEHKAYRLVYDKCKVLDMFQTVPFGFHE